jgi:hypothetical protein
MKGFRKNEIHILQLSVRLAFGMEKIVNTNGKSKNVLLYHACASGERR